MHIFAGTRSPSVRVGHARHSMVLTRSQQSDIAASGTDSADVGPSPDHAGIMTRVAVSGLNPSNSWTGCRTAGGMVKT